MRNRFISGLLAAAAAAALGVVPARAADEDAEARPAPRLPDGTVDLGGNGVWNIGWVSDFGGDHLVGRDEVPYLPWTKAMQAYNAANNQAYDPEGFCLPPGGPRAFATPYPGEIIQDQRNKRIIVIFEGGAHVWREIHMDPERGHPGPEDLIHSYFGDAIGHWEGDVLVVDTIGYNERSWLSFSGAMHTDDLHTIERISRPDYDTLHYEVTIDDPDAYAETWTTAWDIRWSEGQELTEYICQENNQYMVDLKDDLGERFFAPTEGGGE